MSRIARLGLGTVQWGLPYGIANATGRPSSMTVAAILARAAAAGVDLLDTAAAYGEAETVLGAAAGRDRFAVVTKTAVRGEVALPEAVRAGFERSLAQLGRDRVYGLLAHDANQLLGPDAEAVWAFLSERKARGEAERIGVSVYTPGQLEAILERFPIDLVQLPFNIYDQRFGEPALQRKLRAAGVEIHLRSAFLQGLLLMSPADLPDGFRQLVGHQVALTEEVAAAGWSPLEAALGFCLAQPFADRVIVGCETEAQLEQILRAADHASAAMADRLSRFALADENVILPTNWPKR